MRSSGILGFAAAAVLLAAHGTLLAQGAERSGKDVAGTVCSACHGPGVQGAPRIGEREAWAPRFSRGIDGLVRSAIHGHGGMPARGGQANLTDGELRAAILYMFDPAGADAAPGHAAAAAAPRADPGHRAAGGMDIYLGMVRAEALLAYPRESVERTMHGGVPSGPGYYHVNVSLADERTHAPITGARVSVRFEQPGAPAAAATLEPIPLGAASYGNYVRLRPGAAYKVVVSVGRPGSGRPVAARFERRLD
ncbi:MAG: cytochrome c5 family protein [Betaproteobacteria bacterium]|nr:cytochrome c5 family protein [Betaproteobacteria bacterium]